MVFALHWHDSAMDLHVFPIPIPPPTSLPPPLPLGLPSSATLVLLPCECSSTSLCLSSSVEHRLPRVILWKLHEVMHMKYFEQCLTYGKYTTKSAVIQVDMVWKRCKPRQRSIKPTNELCYYDYFHEINRKQNFTRAPTWSLNVCQ